MLEIENTLEIVFLYLGMKRFCDNAVGFRIRLLLLAYKILIVFFIFNLRIVIERGEITGRIRVLLKQLTGHRNAVSRGQD